MEAALAAPVPPRAAYLRALMAELERLANHFGDIGAVCNDASFSLMHAQCAILRERVLRAADACFGHRLMMDVVVPGGVGRDLGADGVERPSALLDGGPKDISAIDRALRQHRLVAGSHRHDRHSCAARWCGSSVPAAMSGAPAGAPSTHARAPGYAPYDQLAFEVPVLDAGDVNARVWVRIREVEQSLGLIDADHPRACPADRSGATRSGRAQAGRARE